MHLQTMSGVDVPTDQPRPAKLRGRPEEVQTYCQRLAPSYQSVEDSVHRGTSYRDSSLLLLVGDPLFAPSITARTSSGATTSLLLSEESCAGNVDAFAAVFPP